MLVRTLTVAMVLSLASNALADELAVPAAPCDAAEAPVPDTGRERVAVPLPVKRDPELASWGAALTGVGASAIVLGLLVIPAAREDETDGGWYAVGALIGGGALPVAVGLPLWAYGAADRAPVTIAWRATF